MQHSGTARIVGVLGIVFLINNLGMTAFAADIDTTIANTGPNSESENDTSVTDNSEISITNRNNTNNDLKLNLNTGGNKLENITHANGLTTGDIKVGIKMENEANTDSKVALDLGHTPDSNISHEIRNTGPHSLSVNEVTINRDRSFSLTNRSDVENNIDLSLNTGDNKIKDATRVGTLRTGDIEVLLVLSNKANTDKSDKKEDCVNCKEKVKPIPTPNATPTPEMGKGGAEVPEVGIVPAGANILPIIFLGLTFLLLLARPGKQQEVS